MTKRSYDYEIEANICGIPGILGVTSYEVFKPDYDCRDSRDDYYGGVEVEFDICDRRGRPAPWLERKVTGRDMAELTSLAVSYIKEAQ